MSPSDLAEALRETAREIKYGPQFWEEFALRMSKGMVRGVDPKIHLRDSKSIGVIAKELYEFAEGATDFESLSKERQQEYYKIIQIVFKGLGY